MNLLEAQGTYDDSRECVYRDSRLAWTVNVAVEIYFGPVVTLISTVLSPANWEQSSVTYKQPVCNGANVSLLNEQVAHFDDTSTLRVSGSA
jgi:hypothetical protein